MKLHSSFLKYHKYIASQDFTNPGSINLVHTKCAAIGTIYSSITRNLYHKTPSYITYTGYPESNKIIYTYRKAKEINQKDRPVIWSTLAAISAIIYAQKVYLLPSPILLPILGFNELDDYST